jgi:hypothetical protein
MNTDEKESGKKGYFVSPVATNLFKAAGIDEEDSQGSPCLTPKLMTAVVPTK